MAKKIRTFQDYDNARRERELNLPEAIESKLEQKIKLNINKEQRELGVIAIVAHPTDFMKALLRGSEGVLQFYLEQKVKQYTPQAEQEAQLDYFQQNMHELIVCGVFISKPHPSLDDSQKQSFYTRFLDNVNEFIDLKHFSHFKTKYSGVEDLVSGFHPPEREDEFGAVTTVTNGLCREKYITRDNADTIIRLLSPRQEVQDLPIRPSSARGRTPAPVPEQIVTRSKSTKEERLEYITAVLKLPREKAQTYADHITLQQLNELHQGMNDTLGDEYARKIIQANPGVVLYPSENLFTKYLTTLQVVQGRIRSNGDKEELEEKFGIKNNVLKYASLEQLLELKRQLFQETGQYHPTTLDESPPEDFQVYVSRYAILKRNPAMEPRLDSLVRTGELLVGGDEHWSGEGTTAGPRGRNILTKIRTELNHLFTDLGYESPRCEINFNDHKLMIPSNTQQLLSGIRDQAYQAQKK